MVIRVMVEGGVMSSDPTFSPEFNGIIQRNSAALRESLNGFFSRALGQNDIEIKVSVASGFKAAAKMFISQTEDDFLYVDLDDSPDHRQSWFDNLQKDSIIFPKERCDVVCFWIPEMEAWFLKQPACLEKWAASESILLKKGAVIADDNNIKGKDIERLQHKPSSVLNTLFSRYFISSTLDRRGKPKKIVYGKLRHAPSIIGFLDAHKMLQQDNELSRFVSMVNDMKNQIVTDSKTNK